MNTHRTYFVTSIFIVIALFPSVSYSTTFKCEFIQEKFKGGKSNVGSCSGDPEITYSTNKYTSPRNKQCEDKTYVSSYSDFQDFVVDLDNKTISYVEVSGTTQYGVDMMVAYHKKLGDKDEKEARKIYGKIHKYDITREILSSHSFTQMVYQSAENGLKKVTTKSYLITYKREYPPEISKNEGILTLYIPENGKSIISDYNMTVRPDNSSWVSMQFGKCVNISD